MNTMKGRRKFWAWCILLLPLLLAAPGCATGKGERIAINATKTVMATTDAALDGWLKYVVKQHESFWKRSAAGEDVSRELADLNAKEDVVQRAYAKYIDAKASASAIIAKAIETQDSEAAQKAGAIAATAAAQFTQIVHSYLH